MEGVKRKLETKPKSIVEKLEQIFQKENFSEIEVFELMKKFYLENKKCNSGNSSEFQKFSALIEKNNPNPLSSLEVGEVDEEGFRTLYTESWTTAFSMEMMPGEVLKIPYFIKSENGDDKINPFWSNLEYYRGVVVEK